MKSYRRRSLLCIVAMMTFAGCSSTYQLKMAGVHDPKDETVVAPALSSKQYHRIMVIPPSGSVRGQFDNVIAVFEREFLKSGITVISGAITGRVVLEAAEASGKEKRVEAAAQLSDAERALVMAKETGADAILQIGEFLWSDQPVLTRYYVLNKKAGASFQEATLDEYRAWEEEKLAYQSQVLTFIGRLTDVQSGQVLASFKVRSAVNWNLPQDYVAEIEYRGVLPQTDEQRLNVYKGKFPVPVTENFPYGKRLWEQEAKEKTSSTLIQRVASKIIGK